VVLGSFLATPPVRGAAKEFDFKDPKGVNSVIFVLDSVLEPIMGVGSGTSGKCSFDPENPKSFTGQITLDAKSLHVPNKGMKDTLHGSDWLDVNTHPTITFNIKEVKEAVPKGENAFEMTVTGELTCKGVTKPLSTKITATYLPNKLQERGGKAKGDLLTLRSNFVIKRRDFDIKPDMGPEVVAEDIEVRVSIVGGHKTG
jgi:polyisoprenoid-binding protein YceI